VFNVAWRNSAFRARCCEFRAETLISSCRRAALNHNPAARLVSCARIQSVTRPDKARHKVSEWCRSKRIPLSLLIDSASVDNAAASTAARLRIKMTLAEACRRRRIFFSFWRIPPMPTRGLPARPKIAVSNGSLFYT